MSLGLPAVPNFPKIGTEFRNTAQWNYDSLSLGDREEVQYVRQSVAELFMFLFVLKCFND